MKRIISLFFALAGTVAAFAQTPAEIVNRMGEEMEKHQKEGLIMTVDVRLPILGSMTTKTYTLGDKICMKAEMLGSEVVTWSDGKTKWTYNSEKNEIEIENEDPNKPTEADGDAEMLSGITDGYDVTLQRETAEAWYFVCKKSRTNKDKDAPKTMDIVVAKGTYYPVSLKAAISGVMLTMRDFAFGVTEKQVTFDRSAYPDARIVDYR